ncbi:helix-turn-helix domain-containing protein [Pseudonocardia lacus]|uniref:PucR family transcriptional regulator n=1 Tax=Pseudonocardia lacus TaxID=2835865 RepID=UPI001BDD0789|nr:helix-turn-helix domain-containing protein [Pseudonocardia lacus]
MTTSDLPTDRVELLRFVDDLLVRHPPLEQAVRDLARRAGRAVAVRVPDGRALVADPAGAPADWPDDVAAVGAPRGITVALGTPATLDDALLLERLAVLAIVLLDRESLTVPHRSQAQLVGLLVDPVTTPPLRSRSLLGLGLRASTPLRAFTVAGAGPTIETFAMALSAAGGSSVLTVTRSRTTVMLRVGDLADLDHLGVPRGLQVGASRVHPASAAPLACAEADHAFRFSQPSPRDHGPYRTEEGVLVRAEALNGYEVLAEALTPEQISRIGDVQALDQVLALGGPDMLPTLDVAVTGSIRQAARALGVHHNSVQHRVAQAERVFGFELSDVYGRNRLFMALTLRRIRQTHGMV